MAVRTRSELRRIDQAQTVHDKRSFGIAIFTILINCFIKLKAGIIKQEHCFVASQETSKILNIKITFL